MRKIGLLGGTFDPPHLGHLLIAERALETCDLDEIWFMPTKIPPHKEGSNLCTDEDRIEMVKRAISNNPFFQLSLIEFERNGPSYTIETIKELQSRYENNDFYFIIGGDMIDFLSKWKDIDELITMIKFIGVKRPGFISKSIYSDKIIFVTAPQMEISSSDIRSRLESGKSVRYLLPDSVIDYIKEFQLYGQS